VSLVVARAVVLFELASSAGLRQASAWLRRDAEASFFMNFSPGKLVDASGWLPPRLSPLRANHPMDCARGIVREEKFSC
jgi:hypothetical protein